MSDASTTEYGDGPNKVEEWLIWSRKSDEDDVK